MRNGPAQVVEQAGREDHQSRPPSVAVIVGASIDWGLVCWAGRGAMLSARPETQPNSCEHTSYQLTVVPVAVVRAQPPVCSRGRRAARPGLQGAQPPAAAPPGRGSAPGAGPRRTIGIQGGPPYSRQPGPQGTTRQPTVWSSRARRATSAHAEAHAWWVATDRRRVQGADATVGRRIRVRPALRPALPGADEWRVRHGADAATPGRGEAAGRLGQRAVAGGL